MTLKVQDGSYRRLVLLRHAKAEPAGNVSDELRPLALQGRRQAVRVGTALAGLGLVPERVVCSDALRTRQTWELLRPGLGDDEPEVLVTGDVYSAGVDDILRLVHETDDEVRTLLVVGHEPVMSAVAARLAGPGSDSAGLAQVRVGVQTATYVVLESAAPWAGWSAAGAVLTHIGRPEA
ncbi:SixA phosphatase family protein [Sanguibacter antarcticus]|uniref:Phosphohistidine phosphatase n=1 Tax=Sanguibacter antarcticus TaxID=372484 RepID=A0A2A9E3I0_9MICO|nr:histidine phosphatase family protein [Sanguibacter antarcticus]PFG33373.1 phosphohistidine phosphatase [Sanguibacter antarcticus]